MQVRITQEIDSTTPGRPLAVGTVLSDPRCFFLCTVFGSNGEPVAEPIDDEAKEKVQPDLDRLADLRRKLMNQAADFRQRQSEEIKADEDARLAEFEQLLKG